MQTRRDQVQAHYFVMGRLVSALLRADPDVQHTPLRRYSMGTFIGVMVAILIICGAAIYGYMNPGGKQSWRAPGTLIVEKETGSRYLFLEGQLHPVLNYTSSRLILGGDPELRSVSRNSLKGVPHGLPIGIEAAPDSLPEAKKLNGTQWQVCSAVSPDESGADRTFVTLRIGSGSGAGLDAGRGLIVRTDDGTNYLAWNNRRMRIPGEAALAALGYSAVPQFPVGAAWINALPSGPDLRPPRIPRRGEPGPDVDGRPALIGELFVIRGVGAADQYFVLRGDGLSPLSKTDTALLMADPGERDAYPDREVKPQPLGADAFGFVPRSAVSTITPGYPSSPPLPVDRSGNAVPCLNMQISAGAPRVGVALAAPVSTPVAAAARAAGAGSGSLADRVSVEPGRGTLVRALPGPGVVNGTLYLITDVGVKYPLPSDDVVRTLGYEGTKPVSVPTTLLELIPTGRPLDPDAAKASIPTGSGGAAGGA